MLSTNLSVHHISDGISPGRYSGWQTTIRQSITYGLIGGSSTLVDFLLFNTLLWLFAPRETLPILLLSGLSAIASSLNSYRGHQRWTFSHSAPRLQRFLALNALTLGMNILLASILVALLPYLVSLPTEEIANLSKLLAVGVSGTAAFLGNKHWVFRK